MKLVARRAEATAALIELDRQTRAWTQSTREVRGWAARHRAGVIVGGGFATGLVTTLLPIGPILRLASGLAGTLSLVLQGPLLGLMTAAGRGATSADGPARAR